MGNINLTMPSKHSAIKFTIILSFFNVLLLHLSDLNPSAGTAEEWEVRLPEALDAHNLLRVNETHLVLVDGYPAESKRVWIHELGTVVNTFFHIHYDGISIYFHEPTENWPYFFIFKDWNPLPDVLVERYSAYAGVVINDLGETEIVVAGGQNNLIELDTVTKYKPQYHEL